MKKKNEQQKTKIFNIFKATWEELILKSGIIRVNEEFILDMYNQDDELNVLNPYSRITSFSLYLYSLEFGSPALYSELNRVTRDMDKTYLKQLGAYAEVLGRITCYVEGRREYDDKIKTGKQIRDEIGG